MFQIFLTEKSLLMSCCFACKGRKDRNVIPTIVAKVFPNKYTTKEGFLNILQIDFNVEISSFVLWCSL
jgi:hypothetical protein